MCRCQTHRHLAENNLVFSHRCKESLMYHIELTLHVNDILCRDASIRYSGSVSAPIRSFSADRVSERRDRSKSDIVRILFCVIVKPHESTKAL